MDSTVLVCAWGMWLVLVNNNYFLLSFFVQGTGLQAQSVFKEKLTFRPHSTSSQTHRKMTLSIADRASKAQKIKLLSAAGMDPEAQRTELIKVRVLWSIIYLIIFFLINVNQQQRYKSFSRDGHISHFGIPPQTIKPRPIWCTKKVLWGWISFLV